jgi:hypothetical protein
LSDIIFNVIGGGKIIYQVIFEFNEVNLISINADDPQIAANNARRLFYEGRLVPSIRSISVYSSEDNIDLDEPILFEIGKSTSTD